MELTQDEWLARYRRRFEEEALVSSEVSHEIARALPFEELCEGFEDDPEGAADSEMSYWDE